ncbi:MAG: YopX family protein [Bacteroidia bacterium]
MNRTVKFRGKDKHTGEWIYSTGFLQHSTGEVITMIVGELPNRFVTSPIVPETLGQFTGLKDRNGVEIYEGDKVKFMFFTYHEREVEDLKTGTIVFDDLGVLFQHEHGDYLAGLTFYSESDIEVVGNIHDKPKEDAGV